MTMLYFLFSFGSFSSVFGVIIIGARNQGRSHAVVEPADYSIIGWDIGLAGDSQTPDLCVLENFTASFAIAHWANNPFGGVDEISAHGSPPKETRGEMSKRELDFNSISGTWAVKRSKKSPTQALAEFMENLQ
jgi:hypothetical protein